MELVVGGLLVGSLALFLAHGRRHASRSNEDKLAVVHRMQGRHVSCGWTWGLVIEHAGFLRHNAGRVILTADDGREQVVPLGQIREIEDANGVQGIW